MLVLAALVTTVQPSAGATPPGQISTFAGTIGEGPGVGVAQRPRALAARGTKVYVGSDSLYVIRELDTLTGRRRVIAGNGMDDRQNPATLGDGDGGPARDASLRYMRSVAVDAEGSLYIAHT